MKMILRTLIAGLVLGILPLASGCATSPEVTGPPTELDGTKWKLIIMGGQVDGRVVKFVKNGSGYEGFMIDPGQKLRGVVGLEGKETRVFQLKPAKSNKAGEFEGLFTNITPDGAAINQEVVVFIGHGTLSWDLTLASWELQKE